MAAIGLTAAAMLTNCSACDDILGEWDRPMPAAVTPSGSETPSEPEEETIPGLLAGVFSVSATEKVQFSQGNLQYTKSTDTWSFMEHQWTTVETLSQNVGDDYASQDVVSLFGWGTAGHSFASGYGTLYQPWETDDTDAYGPSDTSKGLYGDYAQGDWGTNMGTGWRTLTGGSGGEWEWILGPSSSATPGTNCRTSSAIGETANARFVKATVHSTKGVIIFPDEITWNTTTMGTAPTTCNAANNDFTYSPSDGNWTALEAAGCVFLPAAGWRDGTTVKEVGSLGCYKSSSPIDANGAYGVGFNSGSLDPGNPGYLCRKYGHSVRLVRDVAAE